MKWNLRISIITLAMFAAGCGGSAIPERNAEFKDVKALVRSFRDYRKLEKAGVEAVRLKGKFLDRTVSMEFYLYTLGQAFEKFGRESDAAKLYLRLLTTYPVIHQGSQLGVMVENRLRWLLGDKSWIDPSLDDLILRIDRALHNRDAKALAALISRDFAFGRTYEDRFAVKYQEGLELIAQDLAGLKDPTVEVVAKTGEDQVLLKTTGWEEGNRTWFFALRKNLRHKGWEWDLAFWENAEEVP